jgi:hypothetical protein
VCAQCAILAASAATGTRSWIAARGFVWMTPRRLKRVTVALLGAALAVSSVGFGGSTPRTAADRASHAAAAH